MKTAVPREIIDTSGGFEEDNRCIRWWGGMTGDASCDPRNFEIVEVADQSAFDALCEEIFEHTIVHNLISKFQRQKSLYVNNILS